MRGQVPIARGRTANHEDILVIGYLEEGDSLGQEGVDDLVRHVLG